MVLGLVHALGWVKPGPKVSGLGPWGSWGWCVSPLVGRVGAQMVLGLVPDNWCV